MNISRRHDIKVATGTHRTVSRVLARCAAATLTTGIVAAMGVGTASALAIIPVRGPGVPITIGPINGNGGLTGSLFMSTCKATPTVLVTAPGVSSYATLTTAGGNIWTYSVGGLPNATATVHPSVDPVACPFGQWSSLNTAVYIPANVMATAPDIDFILPAKVTTIDGGLIAAGARAKFSDLQLHLNNFGPRHGNSFQLDNSSFFKSGTTNQTFTIPEASINMKLCSYFFCPSLGHALFYVKDMNLSSTSFVWTDAGNMQMTVKFESSGREIQGFYSNSTTGSVSDALMPDAEINDASVTVTLLPVSDGAGGVTFVATGTPVFNGTIQATGPCSVSGWDACDALFGYKSTISSAFANAATATINSPAIQAEIAHQVRPLLDSAGIGYVKGVYVSGYNVTLSE